MRAQAHASPAERRVHVRKSYEGMLYLQYAGATTWFAVHAQDVSAGGFAFFSEDDMRRGEAVSVAVADVPGVTVSATVRHVKASGYGFLVGVEFDEPMPGALAAVLL